MDLENYCFVVFYWRLDSIEKQEVLKFHFDLNSECLWYSQWECFLSQIPKTATGSEQNDFLFDLNYHQDKHVSVELQFVWQTKFFLHFYHFYFIFSLPPNLHNLFQRLNESYDSSECHLLLYHSKVEFKYFYWPCRYYFIANKFFVETLWGSNFMDLKV